MRTSPAPASRFSRHALVRACLLAVLLLVAPAAAQEDSAALRRDPESLARRLLGWNGEHSLPDLPTLYEIGARETFWVGKLNATLPTQVTATLAGIAPNVYVWVEEGIDYTPQAPQQLAQQASRLVSALRWRGTYTPRALLAGTNGQALDASNLYPLPDVDNDPQLYVLFTTDLPEDRDAIVNPVDSLPAALQPSSYGNGHETLVINTSSAASADLTTDIYLPTLFRGVFNLVFDTTTPDQPLWLREALSWFLLAQFQQNSLGAEQAANYLAAPQTPLLTPAALTTRAQTLAGQLLFLTYFTQRYGEPALLDLFPAGGDGMTPLDTVLATRSISDPLTGATVTGDEAFADFVITNGLNGAFGDGRFVHRLAQLQRGQSADGQALPSLPARLSGTSLPYGALYYEYQTSDPTTLEIRFNGAPTVERLNLSNSDDAGNHFYWSGRAPDRDHTLTRAFDLRDLEAATLTYDVWHDLADAWNYGYVEVSTDDGVSWQVVRAPHSSEANRYGASYGPGYTGISNPEGPRPFPVIGVQVANDGVTIAGVEPGGPAEAAGLQAGDVMAGYDGQPWPGPPNILGLLGQYAPGDTLRLWVQRGRTPIDVPVVLGASPTRIVQPEPRWLQERIDLNAYAGQEILVRFEYISLPNRWSEGVAVDNIAIPELDYHDDAEGESDWTQAGWQIVDNQLSARYLVQVVTFGSPGQPPRVQRLMLPGDGANGLWRVPLLADERLLLAVSGMNADTYQPASFEVMVQESD